MTYSYEWAGISWDCEGGPRMVWRHGTSLWEQMQDKTRISQDLGSPAARKEQSPLVLCAYTKSIVGNPVPADENRTRPNEPERHRIVGLPSVAASGQRLPDVDVLSFCGGGGLPPVAVRGGAVKKPWRPCASVGSTVAD